MQPVSLSQILAPVSSLAFTFLLALAAFMLDEPLVIVLLALACGASFLSHQEDFHLSFRVACYYIAILFGLLALARLIFVLL